MKLALLGTGKLGASLLAGLRAADLLRQHTVVATCRDLQRAAELANRFPEIDVSSANAEAVRGASLVLLAPRADDLPALLGGVRFEPGTALVSLVVGVPLPRLRALVGPGVALLRAVCNTSAAVRRAVTVLCDDGSPDPAQREAAAGLFRAVGELVFGSESELWAWNALVGVGPAWLFGLHQQLIAAAVEHGLPAHAAARALSITLGTAAARLAASGADAAALLAEVQSPGGATDAGLGELARSGAVSKAFTAAVDSARRREDKPGRS